MSKEEQARVRDELLQSLYAGVLRCALAAAHEKVVPKATDLSAAAVAGVGTVLRGDDLLLLPPRGAGAFRTSRGLPLSRSATGGVPREMKQGVLYGTGDAVHDISMALGAAAAARVGNAGQMVVAVLPRQTDARAFASSKTGRGFPQSWPEAATFAAAHSLPLLLVAETANAGDEAPGPDDPAPLYPVIPVDRDDALGIYRVAFECSSRARSGGGPSLVSCVPFRVRGKAMESGPLERLEAVLRARKAYPAAWRRSLEHSLVRELARIGVG